MPELPEVETTVRAINKFENENLFLNKLNLIPIYRKVDDEANMGKNVDSFIKGRY